jgi:hypothetical protein
MDWVVLSQVTGAFRPEGSAGPLARLSVVGAASGGAQVTMDSTVRTFDETTWTMDGAQGQPQLTADSTTRTMDETTWTADGAQGGGGASGYVAYVTGTELRLARLDEGLPTVLDTAPFAIGLGAFHIVRINCQGSAIRAMAWPAAAPVPSAWMCEATDATHASGRPALASWA